MPDRRKITDALLSLLETGTSRSIGDAEAPTTIPDGEPWAVVHAIPGGGYDGAPFVDPNSDAAFVYQIDSVGRTRAQAEWMADTVRRTMLARTATGAFQVDFPAVDALRVINREPDTAPGGVTPEGEGNTRVYTVAERYVLFVTPA